MNRQNIIAILENIWRMIERPQELVIAEKHCDLAEYSAIWEGTDFGVRIPRWESAYVGEKNVLVNATTLSVLKEYAKDELYPVAANVPGDDILVETEYLLCLCQDEEKDVRFQTFLKKHYLPLANAVFTRIQEQFQAGYYQELSKMIREDLAKLQQYAENPLENAIDTEKNHDTAKLTIEVKNIRAITEPEKKALTEETIVKTSGRNNCGGKCMIGAHVTAGCITSLESDVEDGEGRIRACARGRGYRKTFLSTGRLRYPMVRVGKRGEGRFRRITWEEALDLMEERITSLTARYGPGCRYVNYATGVTSAVRGDRMAKRLFGLTGGFLGNYNSYSAACAETTLPYIYGTFMTGSSPASYRDSKLLVLWGHNPVVTHFRSEVLDVLKYHKEKGTEIVVIDPQFTDTAAVFSTKWIPVRPGTDAALANAIAYVLYEENLQDQAYMDKYCVGFDEDHMPTGYEQEESFHAYLYGERDGVPKNPAWASAITGVPEETINWLARAIGQTKPTAILAGDGLQRCSNGELQLWSVNALAAMTGNIGIRGGAAPGRGGSEHHAMPKLDISFNPYGKKIPVFLWTDAIVRGHEMTREEDHIEGGEQLDSDIKILFNLAGNTLVNQHSDVHLTEEILQDDTKCEFIVVSDLFYHASAKYADLLLPGASLFETESLTPPWEDGQYLLYGNQAIEPLFESRFEFDWMYELAKRLGAKDFSDGCSTLTEWNQLLYEKVRRIEPELPPFAEFKAAGGYRYQNKKEIVAFAEQIEDIEKHPFDTPSGKMEFFSARMFEKGKEDIPAIPKYMPGFEGIQDSRIERYPLQLIGWHTKRRCHSIHDNNDLMEQVEPHRIWMNPADAKVRGIAEAAEVLVYNDRGKVKIKAHLSERIIPGVVSIPQGAWYTPDKEGVDVRGNINTLAIARPTPLAKGNPQHSNLVEIRLLQQERQDSIC